jgi:hypothetical protein
MTVMTVMTVMGGADEGQMSVRPAPAHTHGWRCASHQHEGPRVHLHGLMSVGPAPAYTHGSISHQHTHTGPSRTSTHTRVHLLGLIEGGLGAARGCPGS